MEAADSSETLVPISQNTQHNVLEYSIATRLSSGNDPTKRQYSLEYVGLKYTVITTVCHSYISQHAATCYYRQMTFLLTA
jgi:hypothetical protein